MSDEGMFRLVKLAVKEALRDEIQREELVIGRAALPDPQRSRTTRAAVHSDAKEACDASTHEFLREKAGHRFCYQCGERLLSEPSLGG